MTKEQMDALKGWAKLMNISFDEISAEIGKQEAIEFEQWREKNNYHKDPNGFYCNRPPTAGVKTWFTVPELYQIFKDEKHL